jgi:parvulin-like peptidyl-prolyl isomerase
LFIVAAVIGLALISTIMLAGYYITFVGPPRETVVRVNDTRYTLGDLVKILRSYQAGSGGGQGLDLSQLPFQVVNLLMENEVIKQFAPNLGISVTEDEITQDIRKTMLGSRKPEDTTPQDQLDREFKERYRSLLSTTRLSEKEHRALVRSSLVREKVRERLSTETPSVAPQYHLYQLTVKNEQLAKEARTEFGRGVAFKDLVAKYSTDSETVRKEGELGWFPKGIYSQLDEVADKLKAGELSEPRNEVVQGAPGQAGTVQYTLYMVSERADARELSDDQRKLFKEQALQKWVAEQRAKSIVETKFGSDEYTWVVQQLRKGTPVQSGPQPQKPQQPTQPAG